MVRRAVLVPIALLLSTLYSAVHAQERRVICVLVDDLGFGASDRENSAKLLAVLRDEVVKESDLVGFVSTGPSAVTADLQPASIRSLQHAMERLGAAASREQAVRPDQSWARPAWRWSPRLTLWEIWRGSRTAISSCFY